MKNWFQKMSRRERLYLIIGAAVLLFGVVVYPALKKAQSYRAEQLELLEEEMAYLTDLHALQQSADNIKAENEDLQKAMRQANDLLFPPIENAILTQTAMIRLLNELGPDLNLEINSGRSSVNDGANQMNLSIEGSGRYQELLKFINRLESYRPLMLVDSYSLATQRSRRGGGRRGGGRRSSQQTTESRLTLRMNIQILCQDGGEK